MMHVSSVNPILENSVTAYLTKQALLHTYRNMNEFEHYNDFEDSRYYLQGSDKYFCLGFSTHGEEDIMRNGGKEVLETVYKDYYGPSVPPVDKAKVTLGVDRSLLPAKTRSFPLSGRYTEDGIA